MSSFENGSLGGLLSAFLRKAARDDFFRVDFTKNIATADPTKVKYCLPQLDCSQDDKQFQLSQKLVQNGKISSPYNMPDAKGKKDDNKYKLSNSPYKELYQCSTKFTRVGDCSVTDAKVDNFDKVTTKVPDFKLPNNGATFLIKGLPKDLQVKHTGAFGTKLEFEYAPGETTNPNYFKWDSETEGSGRGPFTNKGKPRRFCKVETLGKNKEEFNCWFPCYEHADGK